MFFPQIKLSRSELNCAEKITIIPLENHVITPMPMLHLFYTKHVPHKGSTQCYQMKTPSKANGLK